MKRYLITYCLVILILVSACTNARWVVKDENSVDPNDYKKMMSREFPVLGQNLTPEAPVLRLQLLRETTYEYSEKVLIARYIQDYKIRPIFFTLGLLGAGAAFYLANSNSVAGVDGRLETVTLNSVGGILAVSSLLNFKPSGAPRPTGEKRFLRQTGTVIKKDTSRVTGPALQDSSRVNVFYGEKGIINDQSIPVSDGQLEIDLGTPLSELRISGSEPDSVHVEVDYGESVYNYSYPLSSILRPFAQVETSVTELRNSPEEASDNILAELVQGSQLQIVEETGDQWYRVLYGISENYVEKSDVVKVWRTSDFTRQNRVVAVPTVPFGNIDVENNIPILVSSNPRGIALLIGNEESSGDYQTRKYTERDLRLIKAYLENALGYPEKNLFSVENYKDSRAVDSAMSSISNAATDSSEIFIYLSGYGELRKEGEDYVPYLLGSSSGTSINLSELYTNIADLPSKSTVIVNDIDFSNSFDQLSDEGSFQPLENAATITGDHDDTVILYSSEPGQSSQTYIGEGEEDKKHHIFPYFFAKAIQQRNTTISQIYRYLLRNVSYTSRRLHDQPQDLLIFGNQSIDLADQP